MGCTFLSLEVKLNDRISLILFYCVFLSFIPILISTTLFPGLRSGMIFNILVGVSFFIQIVLLLFNFLSQQSLRFNQIFFLFAWVFTISQLLTLYLSLIRGIEINNFDFINVIIRFFSIVFFLCIPLNYKISKKGLETFMRSLLIMGMIACIYNMILNFNGIINIASISNSYVVNFKSFFTNRNSFGQFLFFCLIANTYLYIAKKSNIYVLSSIIIALNLFVTLSRTVVASACIFLIIFILIYFRKRIWIKITIMMSVVMLFIAIFINQKLNNFIFGIFLREENGTSGRSAIWQTGIEILNQTSWSFGIGYMTGTSLIADLGFPNQFHNFFIETLVGGGIVDIILHFIIFIFIIRKIMIIIKNDELIGSIFISAYAGLVFYGFFESASFFSMGYVDTLFRVFFITIPLLYANNFKIPYEELNKKVRKSN